MPSRSVVRSIRGVCLHLTRRDRKRLVGKQMVVRLRLSRFGKKRQPKYHIVVANARTARDSQPIERLGTYDPIPDEQGNKIIEMDIPRVKYWLGVGAQPSEPVEKLLGKANLIPSRPTRWALAAAKLKAEAETGGTAGTETTA